MNKKNALHIPYWIAFLLIIPFILISHTSYANTLRAPILALHLDNFWEYTNSVSDSSGNHYHGIPYNNLEQTSGILCRAAKIDSAKGSKIVVPRNTDFDNLGKNNNDFSVSFWLQLHQNVTNAYWRGVIHKGNHGMERTIFLALRINDVLHHRISTIDRPNEGLDAASKLIQNQWHHITMVKMGNTLQLYIDGTLNNMTTINDSISNNADLKIGEASHTPFMNGLIDEFYIFDYGLTESMVNTIYHNNLNGNHWDGTKVNCLDSAVHHYEIHYPATQLTCLSTEVTVKACTNDTCDSVLNGTIPLSLLPTTGWINDTSLLTGGLAIFHYSQTEPIDTTFAISDNMTILALDDTRCYANGILDPDCTMSHRNEGFLFDIPPQTACKTSEAITIRAAMTDPQTNQCISTLNGSKSLTFSYQHHNPTTGTAPLYINQQLVSPNGTDINVHFDNQGEATLTTQYNDVGQIQISAQYQDDSGFIIQGEQRVIHTPESLVLYRNDNDHQCHSIDAQCSRFKKAGESFDLAIKAVCWQQDNDNNYRDNPTTPNFQLNNITMTSTVIAPETGSNGTLAVETVDFSAEDKGEKNIQQSLSEVGIFELSLSPPAYFGQNISVTPLTVGRFYPHSLGIIMLNDNDYTVVGACDFAYSGQPFSLTPDPLITVTAYNTNAAITTNYRDDFAPLSVDDIRYTMPSTDDQQLGTTGTPLQIQVADNEPTLVNHSDGSLSFSFSGYEYQYLKQANSQIAPFTSQMTIRFNEIRDRDGITTASSPEITLSGPNIYFGRLSIDSIHGSELTAQSLHPAIEYYDGNTWRAHTANQCTPLELASHFSLQSETDVMDSAHQIAIKDGHSQVTLSPLHNGVATLLFSAPGRGNDGYIDVKSHLSDSYHWLRHFNPTSQDYDAETSGRVSFGLFRGNDHIIFKRERF